MEYGQAESNHHEALGTEPSNKAFELIISSFELSNMLTRYELTE
jgi:hypothetical protein